MRKLAIAMVALGAAAMLVPAPAGAQLSKDGQKCVKALHKDGLKIAAGNARRLATCLTGAHDGSVADLGACVSAAPDETVAAYVAKAEADASKRCTEAPPAFGIPLTFDDVVAESAIEHSRGILTELLGASPAVAGTEEGNDCQASALKAAQKLAADYGKAATKCMATAIKEGAIDGDALAACLTPDVTVAQTKLTEATARDCDGQSPAAVLPGACAAESDETVGACIVERVRCRACRQIASIAAIDADCDIVDDAADNDSCSFPVSFSGHAFHFSEGTRVEGANVWVLEHPEMTAVSAADGYYEFTVQEGEEITLVLEHPDFHPIQTGTIRPGPLGVERVTFQAVTWDVYQLMADFLGIEPDEENKCQLVTTVTRVGKSLYDTGAHGETGATVSIDPLLSEEQGPIYFNSTVIPQPSLERTSDDGGVLYVQVDPGEYLWAAHKGAGIFTRVKSKCRAGLLVNGSPPWGLQKH